MAEQSKPPLTRVEETANLKLSFNVILSPLDDFPPELKRRVGDGAFGAGQALEEALQEICRSKWLSVRAFGPLAGTDWGNP